MPVRKNRKQAKDTFNIGVIGAGAIGILHIQSFQKHPAARVVALAEVSPERGREAADTYGIPALVSDYRELLARDDIDVISIALPNYLHATVALEALRAGKHVMLDKPMATNARDAARLVAEARKRRRLFMVGQNMRFGQEVQTARLLVEKGVLGDVYHAKTAWTRRSGIPRIGSWFTQQKFAGGGCTYDIGVHALDRCLYLLGEFDAAAVSGQTYSKLGSLGLGEGSWGKGEIDPDRPFDVDDLAVALIKLKSGRTVLLEASWAAHQEEHDYNGTQLFGTKAGLALPPLRLFHPTKRGYATETVKPLPPRVDTDRMVHFIDCLLGKAEPFVKPEESLAIQKILDAIYQSAKTGREVRIR
ncbi:MAG: gfo/Idh/MocA family oxidoreductase [Verrucomicrobia bacterium]|nr:MAG: gfo/Idh/MocA family oxidoreductase [Verrucomicrobiota bacterium]